MHFLSDYGLFFAKTATLCVFIIAIVAFIFTLKAKAKSLDSEGELQIKNLNEKYDDIADIMCEFTQSKAEKKAQQASKKKAAKSAKKNKDEKDALKHRIFVIRFDGDMKASANDDLRETITAILLTAKENDQVVLCLESGGGLVNAYGLAASQLQRLRDANIYLVVAIDKIAASGGYMMACVANKIIAAPFSIIGSIGVIAQLPNFHRLLEKNNIDFEQITAGEYKRTLTVFGKNTNAAREKLQDEINETHDLFKSFIKDHRPHVDIDAVATGEHWFATQCLDNQLVDSVQTSDDYLLAKKETHDIYELSYKTKPPLMKRLTAAAQHAFHTLITK